MKTLKSRKKPTKPVDKRSQRAEGELRKHLQTRMNTGDFAQPGRGKAKSCSKNKENEYGKGNHEDCADAPNGRKDGA